MGRVNVLVEGVSCSGKTSVAVELERLGHHVVHGDRTLAYRGDPATGEPVETGGHEHHLWRVDEVKALVADRSAPVTFFCGGSRNWPAFVDLFDAVVVLQVDRTTLERRLAQRPAGEWGSTPEQWEQVLRLHATGEDVPSRVAVDASAPLGAVVSEVLGVVPGSPRQV